jgi:transcriptional regulator with XRE-family HTH domain
MPGRGSDPFTIPDPFWQLPEVIDALHKRDIGRLLTLVHQHLGATQTQMGVACGATQPKINAIMHGKQAIEDLAVFERYADGLDMPDAARVQLGLAPRTTTDAARSAADAHRRGRRPTGRPGLLSADADAVAAAANEASADRLRLASECDPGSLDWLRAESLEIACAANRPAAEAFSAARMVRREALELVRQTHRPELLSELYVIGGQATALMASSAFDLNRWDESDTLAKCAASYAALAGHTSLRAWTLGLLALLANWRREPDIALSHFRRGMSFAPPGDPRVRLRYIAARSYALLGDSASVAEVLEAARHDQDDADRHPDSLTTETGGEFGFGRARADACAAAAWLDLGQGREALQAAGSALATLTSLPTARRPLSQVNGARIDMATAYLLSHDLDGGAEALEPLLGQPVELRNVSLTGRLARTRTILLSPAWARSTHAGQLADAIGEWLSSSERHRVQDRQILGHAD